MKVVFISLIFERQRPKLNDHQTRPTLHMHNYNCALTVILDYHSYSLDFHFLSICRISFQGNCYSMFNSIDDNTKDSMSKLIIV